jgi:hypothetical protein
MSTIRKLNFVSISSNSLGYRSNQRLPKEDIQRVNDVEDRLIITTFKEATGRTYYYPAIPLPYH